MPIYIGPKWITSFAGRCPRRARYKLISVQPVVDELRQQHVGIYLHQQQVDTATAAGRAFLQMAGVFAEFEHAIIVERIHSGLARVRAEGKRLGRPPVGAAVEKKIIAARKKGTGMLNVAHELGCGVSAVQRIAASGCRRSIVSRTARQYFGVPGTSSSRPSPHLLHLSRCINRSPNRNLC